MSSYKPSNKPLFSDITGKLPSYTPSNELLLSVAGKLASGSKVDVLSKENPGFDTFLGPAAEWGNVGVFEALLKSKVMHLNWRNEHKRTPLLLATMSGHARIVELLLATGKVYPDIHDKDWQTPLLVALERGYTRIVELLLATGKVYPLMKVSREYGRRLLVDAMIRDDTKAQDAILSTIKSSSVLDEAYQKRLLRAAANAGHTGIVQRLIELGEITVNTRDKLLQTPLYGAAAGGHKEVVELLLTTKGIIESTRSMGTGGPVLVAARNGHADIVQRLLEVNSECSFDRDGHYGRRPLHEAVINGHVCVVKTLLEHGIVEAHCRGAIGCPFCCDSYGMTPLSYAAKMGNIEIVRLLVSAERVYVNRADRAGNTPLSLAARWGRAEVVQFLLSIDGIDINVKDSDGNTPLAHAAMWGCIEVARLLLMDDRICVDPVDSYGYTPLAWAKANSHNEVADLIQSRIPG